jgi:hypothetical protein
MNRFKPLGEQLQSRRTFTILFVMTIGNLVSWPLLSYYWHRDNNGPLLTPGVDYRLNWISDADFRGLDRTDQPEYASENGHTTYAAGETWQLFRPYYVSTPDGKWHAQVLARGTMTPYSFRVYLAAAVPALTFSIMGLAICLYGRKADSFSKARELDRSLQDLE